MFNRTESSKFIEKNQLGPTTRSLTSNKLYIPKYRTKNAQKAIAYRGSSLWNNQEIKIKRIENKSKYKNTLKKMYNEKLKAYTI